jgi:uracil-DNA glycosylase family 4
MNLVPEPAPNCPLCPRLVEFRATNRSLYPDWHNAPVTSLGSYQAQLLIVGLAPGLRGANCTGRAFTGDKAGDLLFATLKKFDFTRGDYVSNGPDDVELLNVMITNAVRCVPPENKPTGAEANACRPFLTDTMASMRDLRIVLALGKIAHDNTLRALDLKPGAAKFAHNAAHDLAGPRGAVRLYDSYHCSRYNINTRRLTPEMFEKVFDDIRSELTEKIVRQTIRQVWIN